MGKVADNHCSEIILTNEDPYDEDPMQIIRHVNEGVVMKKAKIILDRRAAIREALSLAKKDDVILITGKGTDPYIMGPKGTKIPWSDAKVAEEEIRKIMTN
jgi:UDP-N-acetylmuramoyl-L-alanyl-D-glutamate--2,6-diaminopimelate ligase